MADGVPATTPPQEAYGIFAGPVDQQAVQKISNALSIAVNSGLQHVHMLFQSAGGTVGDGVCLYNLFRACPIEVTLYNVGTIASAGVIAYLGAKNRKVSANATFMIHKTYFSPMGATSDRLQSAANAAILDDQRIEAIWHGNITLSTEKWDVHKLADLWISADEAVAAKLATAIGDFAPPKGNQLFYVGPT